MMDISAEVVLRLLHKALDPSWQFSLPEGIDWGKVLQLAQAQGVAGICLEAIEHLPIGSIPKEQLPQWICQEEVQRGQFQNSWEVARKLDRLWNSDGIHATVLKGRSIARYYSVPAHRFSSDLDVFIGTDWNRACELLESKGVRLGREVYKEVEFVINGVYVQCHRLITPLRGNNPLEKFEVYLRSLLENGSYFEGTTLICPPLMFSVMLYIEHALGDYLHGKLSLKHVVDWIVLRRQTVDWKEFELKCKEFKFDRFVGLIDALADVVEGKIEYESLGPLYQPPFYELFLLPNGKTSRSWFQRRVALFFVILKNWKKFRDFGYTSMPVLLFNSVWAHFFNGEMKA